MVMVGSEIVRFANFARTKVTTHINNLPDDISDEEMFKRLDELSEELKELWITSSSDPHGDISSS